MGLNWHVLLLAEMALGRIDQRLLFAAKIFDCRLFAVLSTAMAAECLRPCQ